MFTKYPDGTWACSSVIRATDLIKIANQIFKDNMQYVHISVKSSEYEGQEGLGEISAIPSASSDDVKKYDSIDLFTAVDPDVFEFFD